MKKDLKIAFKAFVNNPQNNLDMAASIKLFDKMIDNTKKCLTMYNM